MNCSGGSSNQVFKGRARFTVLAPGCIRIEWSAAASFVDAQSLFRVGPSDDGVAFCVESRGNETVIETSRVRLEYRDDGQPFSPDNLRALIRREVNDPHSPDERCWWPGKTDPRNLGGTVATLDGVRGPIDLGQGLLSRAGWALVDDSATPLIEGGWAVPRRRPGNGVGADDAADIDWYLFVYGLDFKSALRSLMRVAGAVPLPRRYALGSWYSRYWPYLAEDYRRIVDGYRLHRAPLDVLVLDMDWHLAGWTGWSWNRDRLPDAERLLMWLHQRGVAVTLNLHPAGGVGAHESRYAPFMKAIGCDPSAGETVPFDAGDRRYVVALFSEVLGPLEKDGVDFWWLDWQQEAEAASLRGLSNLLWLNRCFYVHTGRGGMRGQSFGRWGGWGDHRHPIHFSGDALSDWAMLAFEVPFTSTAGNVGCFYWSHDIGGHYGPRNEELTARWSQFGALSAVLRFHSANAPDLDRLPWSHETLFRRAIMRALRLRARLFPFIYTLAWQAHTAGLPLVRPMYLEYPGEEDAYRHPQQYLLGRDLLVAPITEPGAGPGRLSVQTVWLPPGRWCHWFSGELFEGGQVIVASAAIRDIPLFVRCGVPVPLQAPSTRMAAGPGDVLTVRCALGETGCHGEALLYQDDGLTDRYRTEQAHALTPLCFDQRDGAFDLTIGPSRGTFEGRPDKRSVIVEIMGVRALRAVSLQGQPLDENAVVSSPPRSLCRIRVPHRRLDEGLCLRAEFIAADPRAARRRAWRVKLEALGIAEPDTGRPTEESAADLLEEPLDSSRLEAILGLLGIRVWQHDAGPYGYGPDRELRVVDGDGRLASRPVRVRLEDEIGGEVRTVFDEDLEVRRGVVASVGLPPAGVPLGLRLRRTVQVDFAVSGRRVRLRKVLEDRPSHIDEWWVSGPFPYDHEQPLAEQIHGPEQAVRADAKGRNVGGSVVRPGDPFHPEELPCGRPGGDWRRVPCRPDHTLDLRGIFDLDKHLIYGAVELISPRPQPLELEIRSTDGFELWVNGEKRLSRDRGTPRDGPGVKVTASLAEGTNQLLAKVGHIFGSGCFDVALCSEWPLREAPWM